MKRRLPPFPALRAFEAAARLRSFKAAAEELCVTPSAISHQVRGLEEFLDCRLFERQPQALRLTQRGQTYLEHVSPVLTQLAAATDLVSGRSLQGRLTVKMTEGFAMRWLIPRLDGFLSDYPDIDVAIETGLPPTEFRGGEIDIVIHWEDAPVPGVVVEPLMASARVPVCSPEYLRRNPDLTSPAALLDKTLLRDAVGDGWADWFACAGVGSAKALHGPVFAHCELTSRAAEKGIGVALAYKSMIGRTLEAGHLVPIFDVESTPRVIYSVAYEEHRAREPMIVAFRDWLFQEIIRDTVPGMPSAAFLKAAQ